MQQLKWDIENETPAGNLIDFYCSFLKDRDLMNQ